MVPTGIRVQLCHRLIAPTQHDLATSPEEAILYLVGQTGEGRSLFILRGAPRGHDSSVAKLAFGGRIQKSAIRKSHIPPKIAETAVFIRGGEGYAFMDDSIGFLRKCRFGLFACGGGAGHACMDDLVVDRWASGVAGRSTLDFLFLHDG